MKRKLQPGRPKSHTIDSRAAAAVRLVWAEGGAAVDDVKHDYGEDFLVQTHLRGQMDSGRIWVQVKGTEVDCSNTHRSLPSRSVNTSTVLRWIQSSDLVVVILWDVNNKMGWYTIPSMYVNALEVFDSPRKTMTIKFNRDDPFNLKAVEEITWQARIGHLDALHVRDSATVSHINRINGADYARMSTAHGRRTSVLIQFLLDIEALDVSTAGYMVNDTFRTAMRKAVEELPKPNDKISKESRFSKIAIAARRLPLELSKAAGSMTQADGELLRRELSPITDALRVD